MLRLLGIIGNLQRPTMEIDDLRSQVVQEIEDRRSELRDLSLKIHANPELGFQEVRAAGWLCDYLEQNGFQVERGFAELQTAFKASYGRVRPAIAFFAEYDALPELGHACGHNIIAAAAAGAGIAAKKTIDKLGGSVHVIGTPGEEVFGGKAIMVGKGAFDNLDVAMIVHPGSRDIATFEGLACISLEVEYFGKAAHAAARPDEGINALEALILAYNNVNSLRQHVRERSRIHGIITKGGDAPNIVPEHTSAVFLIRAGDMEYLEELRQKVLDCFVSGAVATGARLQHKWGDIIYTPLRSNPVLASLFRQNMDSLGRAMSISDPLSRFGSTDMGNVSQVVPSIHPLVAIVSPETSVHSPQFAEAARSDTGERALLDGAGAMALTLVDLLANPERMAEVKEAFLKQQ
jgi:amidohydrolase